MMIDIVDKALCSGCHACTSVCPVCCITMVADDEGFLYPKVNEQSCIKCGLCEKVCPISLNRNFDKEPLAFAVINKNMEQRLNSSSGGFFILLAEYVISCGGVVFGARFDNEFQVIHDYTENEQELLRFQGSKYVQSRIGSTYVKAKEFLETGRMVLFSGTPCQIEGLKAYLRKDYENLICVDIICHGVPSPKVLDKYMKYRETLAGASTMRMFFRYKGYGWKTYAVLLEFSNDTAYEEPFQKDVYMQAFLRDICLRPSCYKCHFKKVNRVSDITLGDFWGIQNIIPDMDDDKGTSLVILQSDKGKQIFQMLKEKMIYKSVILEEGLKYNTAMICSAKENRNRQEFFENLDRLSFLQLVKKYAKTKLTIRRIVRFILEKLGLLNTGWGIKS